MPHNLAKENINFGDVVYEWSVKEYEKYEHGRRWHVVAGLVGAALILFAAFTGNYLFAMIIVLFGVILFLGSVKEPLDVPFAITTVGIIVGEQFYRYGEITDFWIIYNPPEVKNLYFSFSNIFKHRLQIPLLDIDPRPIRDLLNQYLTENLENEEEPLSDRISRIFRIH